MLGLYLASPLTRDTYLAAKAVAVMAVLGLVTLGPPLFLLLARTIAGTGPEGPGETFELLWKIVLAGVVIAALQAALSLAVASTTTRRAAASAAIILILIGSSAVSDSLQETGDAPEAVFLFDLFALPFELVNRIYGDRPFSSEALTTLSTGALVLGYLGWTAVLRRDRMVPLPPNRGHTMTEPLIGAPPPPHDAVIAVDGVSKWFADVVAVSEVSFHVGRGVTALLGPNGAGKSTMLRMIAGLTPPSQGSVRVLGHDPHRDLALHAKIGLVPQQDALFESLTAFEFVRLAARLQQLDDPREAANRALIEVDLDVDDNRRVAVVLEGDATASQDRPGDRARPRGADPRRASDRPRPPAARAPDRRCSSDWVQLGEP